MPAQRPGRLIAVAATRRALLASGFGFGPAGMKSPRRGYPPAMIGFIVAGLVIGALARLLMPGRQKIGLLWTLLLGLAGSVIGGAIANLIGTGDIMELNVIGFI